MLSDLVAGMNQREADRRRLGRRAPGKLNANRLVILRMGLGRDSMTMLVLLAQGELVVEGKKRGPDEVDAVVFTDPGHEWPFTYDLIPRVQAFCAKYTIRFLWQKKPPADGPGGWIAWLRHQNALRARGSTQFGTPPWRRDSALDRAQARVDEAQARVDGARPRSPERKAANEALEEAKLALRTAVPASYRIEDRCARGYYHARIPLFDDYMAKDAWIAKDDSSCTIIHKITPNREMLADLQEERFGRLIPLPDTARRGYWQRQAEAWNPPGAFAPSEWRPHLMLIGYAADEEGRLTAVKDDGESFAGFESEAYPLMAMKIPKTGEQAFLGSLEGVDARMRFRPGGFSDVWKSGCVSCIHQDVAQWWMASQLVPDQFEARVEHERGVVARVGPIQAIFPLKLPARVRVTKGEVPCDACGAMANQPCLGRSGPVASFHAERGRDRGPGWQEQTRANPALAQHQAARRLIAFARPVKIWVYNAKKDEEEEKTVWERVRLDPDRGVTARQVPDPEDLKAERPWTPVPASASDPRGVAAFVWIPIRERVKAWHAEYVATWRKPQLGTGPRAKVLQVDATGALSGTRGSERREPDVEEIARKEYRGCPLEKIG